MCRLCFRFVDKMYKSVFDFDDGHRSELRINPKHAIGTTLLGPGFIFDLNRVVQTFHSKKTTTTTNIVQMNSVSILFDETISR
jgi:hypothetical protein